MATADPDFEAAHRKIRAGIHTGPTAGIAPGKVQGNLAILPKEAAGEFLQFCQQNPKPCPVIGMTAPGDPMLPMLGRDIDIRTDVPRYRIWRDGRVVDEPTDIRDHWRDDLVAFVLGCSFSFEEALVSGGLRIRHIDQGRNVPMYKTSLPTASAGRFAGPLVVSMRPFTPAEAIRAIQITTRFPAVHGAPVHFGDPAQIGIRDIARPDYGDPVDIHEGEVPVFWACGVTPQAVVEAAGLPFCITHAPGCMLVTEVPNASLAVM